MELTDAKLRKVRGYAQQFESLDRLTQLIADLWEDGLPMTELQRKCDQTAKVTLAQARAAAWRWAAPKKAATL